MTYLLDPSLTRQAFAQLDSAEQQVLKEAVLTGLIRRKWEEVKETLPESWETLLQGCWFWFVETAYTPHLVGQLPINTTAALPSLFEADWPERGDPRQSLKATQVKQTEPLAALRQILQADALLEQLAPALRPPQPLPYDHRLKAWVGDWPYEPAEVSQLLPASPAQAINSRFMVSGQDLDAPPPPPSLDKATLARLRPLGYDDAQAEFTYHLLVAAGLFWPGSPITPWTEVQQAFWNLPEEQQWAALVQSYFRLTTWNEAWAVQRAGAAWRLGRGLSAPSLQHFCQDLHLIRLVVLRLLSLLPADRWLDFRAVTAWVQQAWDAFDSSFWVLLWYAPSIIPWAEPRSDGDHPYQTAWFLRPRLRRNASADERAQQRQGPQADYLRMLAAGPLNWLGLADLAYAGDELVAIRLHHLADLLFDRQPVPKLTGPARPTPAARSHPAPRPLVQVTGDRITLQALGTSLEARQLLEQVGQLQDVSAHNLVYQLSRRAFYTALQNGATLESLLATWRTVFGEPPAALQERLTTWQQAYGTVQLYQGVTLIEFSDAFALAEMLAVTSLKQHLVAQLSPQAVLIPAGAVDGLKKELEQAGYTPKVTDQTEAG